MPDPKHTNHLINETSPYLLQHAHNPVNWYPWGQEALNKAKEENKLIIVSIGYSACHWCHVMEHESFENEEIAQVMNEKYVCIKVDREERPDIDHIYMTAVQLITGGGGWPLNCFALPDGRPVYGGTYFRPEQWSDILINLASSYEKEPERFESAAKDIKSNIKAMNHVVQIKEESAFSFEDILDIILKLRKNFDHTNGGNRGVPKFPMPVIYFALLRYYYHSGDKDLLKHIDFTLQKIAKGGIYDHLGGGFARYSIDKEWLVPHFEKMLYDNAQLVNLYSELYRINPNEEYKKVISETLEFVEREMMSSEGGFYSAYDADSEGVEGKFYVWDKSEINELLKENANTFSEYYNISTEGNWEGKNILNIKENKELLAKKYGFSYHDFNQLLQKLKEVLFQHREKRTKPALDDKILTSWNALMIKGFVKAYLVLGNKNYLRLAEQNLHFIKNNLIKDKVLYRSYKNGKASIPAFLDDYANLIDALIELYQATFNEDYIHLSLGMAEDVLENFYDNKSGMFFYTSRVSDQLIAQTIEMNDNVIPSSNSAMAQNLFKLGHFFLKQEFIEIAEKMIVNIKPKIIQNPMYYTNWIDLMIQYVYKPYEICIVGNNFTEIRNKFYEKYIPNILLSGGNEGELPLLENRYTTGKTAIYVCQNNVCSKPVKSFIEALSLISN